MASRRLRSDRFFATDFTPQVYTPVGMRWIDQNTMATVIGRHYPELIPLINTKNAFAPWPAAGSVPASAADSAAAAGRGNQEPHARIPSLFLHAPPRTEAHIG